ncbi:MAG: GNAT family N-acetyltransferase [Chloroflexota bacterium]
MIEVSLQVRPAVLEDHRHIADLLFFESHVHRHLDWRAPLEWLGCPDFWVLEENGYPLAALACPQGPPGVAWVRLFVHAARVRLEEAWNALWHTAQTDIARQGGAVVAVIAMQTWLDTLLPRNGFMHTQDIVMLEWNRWSPAISIPQPRADIRPMTPDDLPRVAALDAAAFSPLWQNPLDALSKALAQAQVATVMEDGRGLAGYQISTANPFGAHLARLAVRPDAQGAGLGSAIVLDLIQRLKKKGSARLTVNTQSDNHASLALYRKLGFRRTGEQYSVYYFDVPPDPTGKTYR